MHRSLRAMFNSRKVARDLLDASLSAVNPTIAVKQAISYDPEANILRIKSPVADTGELALHLNDFDNHVHIVGAGKAACGMMEGLLRALSNFSGSLSGRIITKYDHTLEAAKHKDVPIREAAHPVTDANGVEATQEIVEYLQQIASPRSLVLVLLSGGASALLSLPVKGVSLTELQALTQLMLGSGADINELNTVRKHLSQVKGGRLASVAGSSRLVTLVVSDVIGDPLHIIGSGPTTADTSLPADAWAVVKHYGLETKVSDSIREHLCHVPEDTKVTSHSADNNTSFLVANNSLALEAAYAKAMELKLNALILTSTLEGEAKEVGKVVGAMASELVLKKRPLQRPCVLILGGETTVTLGESPGLGGRNQELACSASRTLHALGDDAGDVCILSAGTDGTDGPTDSAGGLVDPGTVQRAIDSGIAVEDYLAAHNCYVLLEASGDHVKTGPTNTNVMDLVLVVAL